ncbi:ankyrin repeat domain-containing protein [Streptomyces sp. NPDC102395]|uniref:ankyrin repeat domain-containing protein n=1 Tax=Streptomyces sp. NPDC102395 TaxID=3366168 RepID=UPI0037FC9954
MDDGELVTAVRRGDAKAVTRALEGGASPDAAAEDGLPVLCLAVAGYDTAVAAVLVEGGADQDRRLPDGTTPLLRAVDSGSPSLVAAVLGREPRLRLPEADRARLLAVTRDWCERGAEEVLRGRTNATGPATHVRVMDDEFDHVTELTLGGHRVRAGHAAILTDLEWAFRVLTPVDELVARAVGAGDRHHVAWSSVQSVFWQRRSRQTWSALTAYRHAPAREARLFVLDALNMSLLSWHQRPDSHEQEMTHLLLSWADEGEEDSEVLAELLYALSETMCSESAGVGLRFVGHGDPRVRARVAPLLLDRDAARPFLDVTARTALLTLAADRDPSVRAEAGSVLCLAHDRSDTVTAAVVKSLRDPEASVRGAVADTLANLRNCDGGCGVCAGPPGAVADALVALLDEEDFLTRLNAAYVLVRRDDPRVGEAIERMGPPPGPGFAIDHRLSALRTWQREHGEPSAPVALPPSSASAPGSGEASDLT